MKIKHSQTHFKAAQELLPGGVNSPVRAFKGVGGTPLFIERAEGAHLYDVDGNRYIDYVGSWGPMIVGHAHPDVVSAVKEAVHRGTSYGAPTAVEIELAKMVVEAMPSIEMVRFVNSGTEATMSALRLARGFTGRSKIIKFEGCYHGHADMLLAQAGSGVTTLGLPDSPGVPKETVSNTLLARFNDLESVQRLFEENPKEIAAVIIEPVGGNMGVVPPVDGFLGGLRQLTKDQGTLLIFDEVMTGFRVAYGGAQSIFGVTPDLTCLGKVIGGGFPVGAYGGRREIMEMVAPVGPVYQAGTLSGNPIAMTAGIETLKILRQPGTYDHLDSRCARLSEELRNAADAAKIPYYQTSVGSMSCLFFTDRRVVDFDTAKTSDTKRYGRYFHEMLKQGVYLAPSQFEAAFVSLAHTDEDLQQTCSASAVAMSKL